MTENSLTSDELNALSARCGVISKWGSDTISMFEKNIKTDRPSNRLCITTLSVCSTYCTAIMTLLKSGLRMPAKALLRVLFEVNAKVIWCLTERRPGELESAVEERIDRWARASLEQDIKLRRDYLSILAGKDKEKLEETLERSEEMLDQQKCERMPRLFPDVLRELGDPWQKEFYPQLYRRFNDAVHLDFGSLCSKAKDDGTTISVTNDSHEAIEELAQYCLLNTHIILLAVREYYEWNSDEMNKDFKAVS